MRAPAFSNRVLVVSSAVLFAGTIVMDLLSASEPTWFGEDGRWITPGLHQDVLWLAAMFGTVGLVRCGLPSMAASLYRMAYRHGAEDTAALYARPEYRGVAPMVPTLLSQRGLRHRFRFRRPTSEVTTNDHSKT